MADIPEPQADGTATANAIPVAVPIREGSWQAMVGDWRIGREWKNYKESYFVTSGPRRRDTIGRFPVSEEGWAKAWAAFCSAADEDTQVTMRGDLQRRREQAAQEEAKTRLAAEQHAEALRQRAESLRQLDANSTAVVTGLALLGLAPEGSADARVEPGGQYDIRLASDAILLLLEANSPLVVWRADVSEIENIEIYGPGEKTSTTGGGFVGGGFGGKSALKGVAVAAVLNSLTSTTSTSVKTFLRFETSACELTLLCTKHPPELLRSMMAPVFIATRNSRTRPSQASIDSFSVDPIDRLTRLADLRDRGAISVDEFDAAKAKLLGSL